MFPGCTKKHCGGACGKDGMGGGGVEGGGDIGAGNLCLRSGDLGLSGGGSSGDLGV